MRVARCDADLGRPWVLAIAAGWDSAVRPARMGKVESTSLRPFTEGPVMAVSVRFEEQVEIPLDIRSLAADSEGDQRSDVLGRSCRLTRSRHAGGRLAFDLHEKE